MDGIALVLHMTQAEGWRLVEEGLLLHGWQAEDNGWLTEAVERRPEASRDQAP